MLLNCDAGEMLESSLDCKEIKSVNPKGNQPWIGRTHAEWSLSSNAWATWCEEPTFWKRPWCWERSKANRERGSRGWDSYIASQTQRTWIWATSRKQWRIESLCAAVHGVTKSRTRLRDWTIKRVLECQLSRYFDCSELLPSRLLSEILGTSFFKLSHVDNSMSVPFTLESQFCWI